VLQIFSGEFESELKKNHLDFVKKLLFKLN